MKNNNPILPWVLAVILAAGGWTFGILQKSYADSQIKRVDRIERILDEVVPTLTRIETMVIQIKKSMEKYGD